MAEAPCSCDKGSCNIDQYRLALVIGSIVVGILLLVIAVVVVVVADINFRSLPHFPLTVLKPISLNDCPDMVTKVC